MATQISDRFKRRGATDWTPERIAQLSVQDIKQLRANAERLNEPAVAALCNEALRTAKSRAPAHAGSRSVPRTKAR